MKRLFLLIAISLIISGCAVIDITKMEERRGTGHIKIYNAPSEKIFKIAKSISFRSKCNAIFNIYDDEIKGEIFSRTQIYIPEIIWLVTVESINTNSTRVELIYSPGVIGDTKNSCFTKELFDGINHYLESEPIRPVN